MDSFIMSEDFQLKYLVTAKELKTEPIYNWYYYPHSFSPQLVEYIIKRYSKDDWSSRKILDMFCGGGTTILKAQQLGIDSHGIDIMPLSYHVTLAKISKYDNVVLVNLLEKIVNSVLSEKEIPVVNKTIKELYDACILNNLLRFRNGIREFEEPYKSFFLVALIKLAEKVSTGKKAGGFHRKSLNNITDDVADIYKIIVLDMMKSLKVSFETPTSHSVDIGDARNIKSDILFDWVITSPPYPNRQDYTRIFLSELMLTFTDDEETIKKLRYETLRSHLEAKQYISDLVYVQPHSVDLIIDDITKEILKRKKKDFRIPRMISGYFEDMFLVLSSLRNKVKEDAHICFVVSNVRHLGVNVEVDKILAEIALQCGFRCLEIITARYRGNSSQQMRDYKRVPSRESIVTFIPTQKQR